MSSSGRLEFCHECEEYDYARKMVYCPVDKIHVHRNDGLQKCPLCEGNLQADPPEDILVDLVNWRSAATVSVALATFLGGFSVALLLLSLGGDIKTASSSLAGYEISTRATARALLAAATVMFLFASEFFLHTHASDFHSTAATIQDRIQRTAKAPEKFIARVDLISSRWWERGRWTYNLGVFLLLAAVSVIVVPYQQGVSVGLGIAALLQIGWFLFPR